MQDTTFVSRRTPITADWLNEVNDNIYEHVFNVMNYGAAGDGSTDDYDALVDAQDACYAAGGGFVYVPFSCAIGTKLVLKSGVNWRFGSGAKLVWIGSTSGTCVETDSTTVYKNVVWENLTIDSGSSFTGVALHIHSAHNIKADVIRLITTGTTSYALKMTADSSAGETTQTKRNVTQVVIGSLLQHGQCGTLLYTEGIQTGYDGTPQVITACTIGSIFTDACAEYGIRLYSWTDNNSFPGYCMVSINANDAVGVQIGGPTSPDNLGVYSNYFGQLAVNAFGTYTGRIGLQLERSKLTRIGAYYQYPEAEGGAFIEYPTAQSYDIQYHKDDTAKIIHLRRGMRAASEGFTSSDPVVLADDNAVSFNVDEDGANENITFVLTISTNAANCNGVAWLKVRRSSGSPASEVLAGGSAFAVTTGTLAGTTGTDTKFTVSAAADGKFYVENRTGASITFVTHVAGWMQTA